MTPFFNRYWDEIRTGRADIRERLAVALLAISPGLTVDEPLTYWFQHDSRLNRELLNDLAALRDAGLRVYRRLIRNTHERSI